MRHPFRQRALAPLCSLAVLALLVLPGATAHAARTAAGSTATTVHRSRHLRIYGYLRDAAPATDHVLLVWSKAHQTTYHVVVTASTVVRNHGQSAPRAALQTNQYVIVTCDRSARGALVAVRVSIVHRRAARRRHH